MGRSVAVHPNAVQTVYTTYLGEDQWEWNDFVEDVKYTLKQAFPSMQDCSYWEHRECQIILENEMAQVSLSEYCGSASVSLVPIEGEDYYPDEASMNPLRAYWAETVNFHKALSPFDQYRRIGTFSNGESVYEKVA